MTLLKGNLAIATLYASLLAVALSILSLAIRLQMPIQASAFVIGYFGVVAVAFVWPPLAIITFILGVVLTSTHQASHAEGQAPIAAKFPLAGAGLGALLLPGFLRLAFGVGFLELACWLGIGAIIGAASGFVFQRTGVTHQVEAHQH
jgi:hypothetical protein